MGDLSLEEFHDKAFAAGARGAEIGDMWKQYQAKQKPVEAQGGNRGRYNPHNMMRPDESRDPSETTNFDTRDMHVAPPGQVHGYDPNAQIWEEHASDLKEGLGNVRDIAVGTVRGVKDFLGGMATHGLRHPIEVGRGIGHGMRSLTPDSAHRWMDRNFPIDKPEGEGGRQIEAGMAQDFGAGLGRSTPTIAAGALGGPGAASLVGGAQSAYDAHQAGEPPAEVLKKGVTGAAGILAEPLMESLQGMGKAHFRDPNTATGRTVSAIEDLGGKAELMSPASGGAFEEAPLNVPGKGGAHESYGIDSLAAETGDQVLAHAETSKTAALDQLKQGVDAAEKAAPGNVLDPAPIIAKVHEMMRSNAIEGVPLPTGMQGALKEFIAPLEAAVKARTKVRGGTKPLPGHERLTGPTEGKPRVTVLPQEMPQAPTIEGRNVPGKPSEMQYGPARLGGAVDTTRNTYAGVGTTSEPVANGVEFVRTVPGTSDAPEFTMRPRTGEEAARSAAQDAAKKGHRQIAAPSAESTVDPLARTMMPQAPGKPSAEGHLTRVDRPAPPFEMLPSDAQQVPPVRVDPGKLSIHEGHAWRKAMDDIADWTAETDKGKSSAAKALRTIMKGELERQTAHLPPEAQLGKVFGRFSSEMDRLEAIYDTLYRTPGLTEVEGGNATRQIRAQRAIARYGADAITDKVMREKAVPNLPPELQHRLKLQLGKRGAEELRDMSAGSLLGFKETGVNHGPTPMGFVKGKPSVVGARVVDPAMQRALGRPGQTAVTTADGIGGRFKRMGDERRKRDEEQKRRGAQ